MQHVYEFILELNKPDLSDKEKESLTQEQKEQLIKESNYRIYRDRFVTESSRRSKVAPKIIGQLKKYGAITKKDNISNFYLAQLR